MAENLQSNPSDWQTGESNPEDFTAEAVVEVLGNADEDEVNRVKEADDRKTVQDAADDRLTALGSDDGGDDEEEEDEGWADDANVDDDYNPYNDPDVPSSAVAQVVATELQNGESPTLNAIREGKK